MTTLKANGRSLVELGWKWPEKKYALGSWLIPLCYAAIAYLLVWCTAWRIPEPRIHGQAGGADGIARVAGSFHDDVRATSGTFGLAKSLASSLGEEIGWRGFLVPQLFKSVGFTGTALISGVVWSAGTIRC